ncbi:glycoside hydrolase family 13 protein [Micromonospora sp. NPDC050980]|uniref:glycoside hydrolase family 13 protein n=1 Tax=Micromonospora sp. NPDC050980 TaxID=3155161 RepID=UPI003405A553
MISQQSAGAAAEQTASRPWWRDAVCYQVYVRSFADGTGDGVGDLPGAAAHLPHLASLGVDAVWLTPFYPSPMADGGYDVADHRDVDPLFGDLADFDAFVERAHRLGLRVMVDVVPNHCSTAHPWFVEALAAPPGSAARRRFVFRPGRGPDGELPPNNWQSDFGGPAWTRTVGPDGRPGEWYLHLFAPEQPDFDWSSPEVADEFDDILRFWLDRGVDGFRIDVAHGLVKRDGLPDNPPRPAPPPGVYRPEGHEWDQPGVHEIYRRWRRILDAYPGDRMAIGEAWVTEPEALARYVRPDELHQAFNFHFLQAPWDAGALRIAVRDSLDAVRRAGAPASWVLGNHDVVRPVTRYGDGPTGLRRARAAALLMLFLPGSVYLYQGEELGLPEVLDLPDEVRQDPAWFRSGGARPGRDGCRVPMPWRPEAAGLGFAPADATPWLPLPADWAELAVDRQRNDPTSTLRLYRSGLRLRAAHLTGADELAELDDGGDALVLRRGRALCVTNLGPDPVPAPAGGRPLLASAPLAGGATTTDVTSWWLLGGPG